MGAASPFEKTPMAQSDAYEILSAIRRIVRAVDLHSRTLRRESGLNVPQLLTLEAIAHARRPPVLATDLARQVGVSPGTMSGIVEHLVRDGLVDRQRAADDRRRVHLSLSAIGRARLDDAPTLLQKRLLERLHQLPDGERADIQRVLEQVIGLMEARDLDASPILTSDARLKPHDDG